MKIRLGINIDHIATLRQVRGNTTSYPDILNLTLLAIKGGADLITLHLREDRRHIQEYDLALLKKKCPVPLNLEMAPTMQMLDLALKYKPSNVCLVPEKRRELTTEGGLDIIRHLKPIQKITKKLNDVGIKVSLFIDPDPNQLEAMNKIPAKAIELHTGKWTLLKNKKLKNIEWKRLVEASCLAKKMNLQVHAGHGLDFSTTKEIIVLPYLEEVNIGHSVICYSLEYGILKVVKTMRKILNTKNK